MKVVITIVATPAFIACVLNPSLVSAAVTILPPALAAPSTPNVSPAERRMEPVEANGNEGRASLSEVIKEVAGYLHPASILGNVVSGVRKTASGALSGVQGATNKAIGLYQKIVDIHVCYAMVWLYGEVETARTAVTLIHTNEANDVMSGLTYLLFLSETKWKTKTLAQIAQLLKPELDQLHPATLVVLGNIAYFRLYIVESATKLPGRGPDGIRRWYWIKASDTYSTPGQLVTDALAKCYPRDKFISLINEATNTPGYRYLELPLSENAAISWEKNIPSEN
uniref:RxLR effector candidate protein n=1 Tax=Hyaloperonospora arabidopsidis (strain Emoy2) TaxID=559515 RepID=M4C2S2_HYAAE|nr:RxLR effector candidate protein [Hyaloperonospora arabidopsidis Emoy2]